MKKTLHGYIHKQQSTINPHVNTRTSNNQTDRLTRMKEPLAWIQAETTINQLT